MKPVGDFDAIPARLRGDVRLLGTLLGEVIAEDRGNEFVERIERIRALAKTSRLGEEVDWSGLTEELRSLEDAELVDIARAFNQFLNLANLAEQKYSSEYQVTSFSNDWQHLHHLRGQNLGHDLEKTQIELVLTAHPTEVLRRTLIRKYEGMVQALKTKDTEALKRLICEAWHTDEIRHTRPTPLDEAQWGFNVLENSLWEAVPALMRQIDHELAEMGLEPLDPRCAPFRFASWMGGDRDGNPHVTADVTAEVLKTARRRAAANFLTEVEQLIESLSIKVCTPALSELTEQSDEPYRWLLSQLLARLENIASGEEDESSSSSNSTFTNEDLVEPLMLCYESLSECGLTTIARGPLLDTIRRACCFGINLVKLDIRQDASRHTQVLDELTDYLGESDTSYAQWSEEERVEFLVNELSSKRPLIPSDWQPSDEVREVLKTFELVTQRGYRTLDTYIISMANQPSDVLAVLVLLKAYELSHPLQIVPLYETLGDLDRAGDMLFSLLSVPAYRDFVRQFENRQQVMIGYSDSAKDAGQFAAAWAQYRAQEALKRVADSFSVELTLFHGRGGAIGRGGGPTHEAILAQPPGTVASRLRLTEQGEMIRFKLGAPDIAFETLARYLFSTIEATHTMRSADDVHMRNAVSEMADQSTTDFRDVVSNRDFVSLFNQLTPEQELAELAIGSRPNRRGVANRTIQSLRAIPWVFAWTQVRLMLPAWLGTLHVLEEVSSKKELAPRMLTWPFFRMQIELLEVMLAKVEPSLAVFYAERLEVGHEERELLDRLLDTYERSVQAMCRLRNSKDLLTEQTVVSDSLRVRNTYLDPLHLLQAELLARFRSDKGGVNHEVEQALKVTMAGIASGLRNTG